MASAEAKLFQPCKWTATATATNGTATATKAAATLQQRHYLSKIIFSTNIAVATAQDLTISDGGSTIIQTAIPVGFIGTTQFDFDRPYECGEAAALQVTIGALGASVVSRITVMGFTA